MHVSEKKSMRKILDISTSFKSPSRFVLICSFFFIAHMKSLISTFNCSLLQQTFPIHYLASVKYSTLSAEVLTFQQALIWAMISVLSVRVSNATAVFPVFGFHFCKRNSPIDNRRGFTPAVIEAFAGINRALHAYGSQQQMMSWRRGSRKWRHQPGPYLIGCLSLRIWQKAPRGVGKKRNLAVQSVPHHSSLFTCLPVSTPGSLSNLSCPPSRRPPLFLPTHSEDTLPPPPQAFPLSSSHFKLRIKLTFCRQRGTSKVFDELGWINSLSQIKKKPTTTLPHIICPRFGVISSGVLTTSSLDNRFKYQTANKRLQSFFSQSPQL